MRILLVFAVLAMAAGFAQSQQYPTKPVRIIAPFAPGGGTDFIARLIAQKLTERLGQQVIVENKPGAGGNLGAEFAVKSAPDGYTLLLVAGSYTVNPSLYKLSFDPVNDITPIVQLSQGPFVVAVPSRTSCRTRRPARAASRTWRASCSSTWPRSRSSTSRTRAPARR
ncbi:MAG: hypothetical protein E6H43_02405 [Betaproteobacteria bacterium]|nr:MAG: hypothetical protein E6H43_02405 [Betaproteobacteria bacterium]